MKVAVVGATGLVGRTMLELLEKRDFPVSELIPVASARSAGKQIEFKGTLYPVVTMDDGLKQHPDIAIFSAGGSTSKEWAPAFAAQGCYVVDNSSAWRMDPDKKLIVPEINAGVLGKQDLIIANPNCSTIQLVVALGPLHQHIGIKRLVISTYQALTGTGKIAVDQYDRERAGETTNKSEDAYPHPIFENCIPHCDVFFDNGYTREELKLVNETRKILGDEKIAITATAVRVPVLGGHSESINIEFNQACTREEIMQIMQDAPGIVILDDPKNHEYPMPLMAKGRDEVFVGRIRVDESQANTFNMWVVADNLRKGAATNAIQIAEYLVQMGYLPQA
jgi:aspartate-semialdehyde dehydrogenase